MHTRNGWAVALPTALLLLALAFGVWRAGLETSLWLDETASLVLANRPPATIVDLSTIDTNPPGYPLALKAWLRLGRLTGAEPGIRWARLLGTLSLLLMAVAAWREGRRLLGAGAGGALALAVAASSYASVLANDARGYAIASVALFAAFLSLLRAYEALVAGDDPHPYRRWLLYLATTQAALWTHLLSLLLVGLLGLLWLGMTLHRRAWRSPFALGGALAHLVTALLYLPWLLRVHGQTEALKGGSTAWMTPASGANLGSVFWYWFPFGRLGDPFSPPAKILPLLGLLSFLLPAGAALLLAVRGGRGQGGRGEPGDPEPTGSMPLRRLGLTGIGLVSAFVLTLWGLQRFGFASVFHGPRYPALGSALWAAGLVGLAGWAGSRTRSPNAWTWILLTPWLLAGLAGRLWVPGIETQGGLQDGLAALPSAPPPGATLYTFPSELLPFHRRTLSPYTIRRIEDLPCTLGRAREAWVLRLSPWRLFDRPRDLLAQQALEGQTLAERVDVEVFPERTKDYTLYHLVAPRAEAAAELCRRGLVPAGREIPAEAATRALPEDQRSTDGWSYPEVSAEGSLYRWAESPRATIRFDAPLPAGDYVLHYRGYRTDQPQAVAPMTLELDERERRFQQPAGGIDLQIPIHLSHALRAPLLVVGHPIWSPPPGASGERRRLASSFLAAWLERAPSGR